MKDNIKILPGTPNDDNRDYLPLAIKGSDMVVNENGNNSQVYPARLKEYKGEVLKGIEETWYEYVPESYDGSAKVPLVVSMHGGAMTGWGQAIYTSWTMVADREGFIVLFPTAHSRNFWTVEMDKETLAALGKPRPDGFYLNMPPEDPNDNHDMNFVIELIDRMKEKYSIDESRIYMQGMSMGNMMTAQFARCHGELLTCMGGSAGPTCPDVLYDENGNMRHVPKPVAVWQSRCENDFLPTHHTNTMDDFVVKNREYWQTVNGCKGLPEIKIDGEDNFAFYKGEHADMVFRDIKNRDHGQTLDDAELVWDYLFSGTARDKDGNIVHTQSISPRKGDIHAAAFAEGSEKAYAENKVVDIGGACFIHEKLKYHGLDGGTMVRGEYFMVPLSYISKFYGCKYEEDDGGLSVTLTAQSGQKLKFARGSIGCLVDGKVCSMLCESIYRDGKLYAPIEWISRKIFKGYTSACDGVLYVSEHWAELSLNMAHLIRDEILI